MGRSVLPDAAVAGGLTAIVTHFCNASATFPFPRRPGQEIALPKPRR
jgi:hypothetical protein